jgi:type I restriction enzyme R subunit
MSEELKPFRYEPIALSNESTVVAEFQPDAPSVREATLSKRSRAGKGLHPAIADAGL